MSRTLFARATTRRVLSLLLPALLAACGGGKSASPADSATGSATAQAVISPTGEVTWLSKTEAVRLAHQATFGPTEAVVNQIMAYGASGWLMSQMTKQTSFYMHGGDDSIHRNLSATSFCEQAAYAGPNCWRDWYSTEPLLWDFYRNAIGGDDQLRQRVAFALSQIVVVSNKEVEGTYGLRNYQNMLLNNAFGNYRQILRSVALSPVMGDYLNNVNNDKAAPNENFARELMQLFSIGPCQLNADGTLQGGQCTATYDNNMVRNYAYALTGWTYPAGGTNAWSLCWPEGTNCRYYNGDMVNVARYHDTNQRALLSGVTVPAGTAGDAALDKVLDSLMAHPNIAPFISRQLIQHLVMSNPSPAYVQRVAQAFSSGRYQGFGGGQNGDLAATIAAILLDPEAMRTTPARSDGKLREPVLFFTGVLRALGGVSDGESFSWWLGENLQQHVFRPPTVFSYFPVAYPVPGTSLNGPTFAIHSASTAFERLNFLNMLLWWGGSKPDPTVPAATGTKVYDLSTYEADADDPGKLVDRLSILATGNPLPDPARSAVINAVTSFDGVTETTDYKTARVKQAAWLIFASPNYQVMR